MSENTERKCPECNAPMFPISIIDRSKINEIQSVDSVLSYASPEAKPGWFGSIKPEGFISSFACTECGRILLYANKSQ